MKGVPPAGELRPPGRHVAGTGRWALGLIAGGSQIVVVSGATKLCRYSGAVTNSTATILDHLESLELHEPGDAAAAVYDRPIGLRLLFA